MTEFNVINIEQKNEFIGYKEYKLVILTIVNLESYYVSRKSILNFQTRLFYELNNLFWDPSCSPIYIRIEKDESEYKYIIRVTNIYMLKNIVYLENLVNRIFYEFPFKFINKKRRVINEYYIRSKIQKINLNIE